MKNGKTAKKASAGKTPGRAQAPAGQTVPATGEEIDRLGSMAIRELQRLYAEVIGEATRCPNRTWLVRKITEAAVAVPPVAEAKKDGPGETVDRVAAEGLTGEDATLPDGDAAGAVIPVPADGPGATAEDSVAAPKLSKLDLPALQALYAEVTGRETRSVHRGSLIYRIREAQKGNGPSAPRAGRQQADGKVMVLPLRMEASLVDRLDEAWRRLGLRSRTTFLRAAIAGYLADAGERALADLLLTRD